VAEALDLVPEIAYSGPCWLPLSICGGEFKASRPVPSTLDFVLQFVEQPAEFGRVLFGASKFDRPILRVAEVSVQEAV
jgi:hypothetical protein